jgi:hypothetical protein
MDPLSSRSTAWKMRRPARVGITPLLNTVPDHSHVRAGSTAPILVTVLAS